MGKVSIAINAPLVRMCDVSLNPELIKQYMLGTQPDPPQLEADTRTVHPFPEQVPTPLVARGSPTSISGCDSATERSRSPPFIASSHISTTVVSGPAMVQPPHRRART